MNKFTHHVFVIPEDVADEKIANGFAMHDCVDGRRIQVMEVAGGWTNVLAIFEKEYIPRLRNYPLGHVVMLIDFDGENEGRMEKFQHAIPDDLTGRVFILGSLDTPESLRAALHLSLEEIGRQLAEACASGKGGPWDHEQLRHNARERLRLATVVQPFLFL